MKSLIALLYICILISSPLACLGNEFVQELIDNSEYDLARLELYKQMSEGDSLLEQRLLPVIAYTYQLEGKHLKAKSLYKEALRNNSALTQTYTDSIKTNLCYSLMELYEFGAAYGLMSSVDDSIGFNVKKRFYILTAERQNTLDEALFSQSEIISYNEFTKTLKKPNLARCLSIILPGAGQFYSSHGIDGVQALMVVGAGFLYSTISVQSYNKGESGILLPAFTVGVTSLFYYANVLSGYRTAIYRNMKLKQDFLVRVQYNQAPLNLSLRAR
jgi:TM2 domain-containing membrane protein YozV